MAPRGVLSWPLVAGRLLFGAGASLSLPLAPPPALLAEPCAAVFAAGEAALQRGEAAEAAGAFTLGAARCPGDGAGLTNLAVSLAVLGNGGGAGKRDLAALCEALAAAQLAVVLERDQGEELVEAIEEALGDARGACLEPPLGDPRALNLSAALLAAPGRRPRGRHVAAVAEGCSVEGAVAVAATELERERGIWTARQLRTIFALLSLCGVVLLEGLMPAPLLTEVASAWQLQAASQQNGSVTLDAERRGRGRRESRLPMAAPFSDEGLAGQPLLLGLVRFLVGERAELDTFSIIESEPGSAAQPWHCDAPVPALGRRLPLAGVVAVVPLADVAERNGATEFLMGSHADVGDERFWAGGDDGDGASDNAPRVALRTSAGGVALFDLRLRHRGGANRAEARRSVLYMSYVQDWFRDATNFKERQTRAWDALPATQRRLFARLDARRYVGQLEELVGARAPELRSEAAYARGKLEL